MSERYTKLFHLPENLYMEGSPVIIAAGALLKDNQTGRVIAQLKLRNISPKVIKAVTVSLFPMNTAGKPLGDAIRYEYLDLSNTRDTYFGSKSAISLPDASTRSFGVAVVEVIFADRSVWDTNDVAWEAMEKPKALDSQMDSEMTKQFRIEYGNGSKNFLFEEKDLWHCVCGAINHREETECHSCRKSICELKAIDTNTLREHKEQRLAKESEKVEKEAAKSRENAQKTKKITAVVASAVAVAIALFFLINSVIIPNGKYNNAVNLMNAGRYEEAIVAFEAVHGYKDSATKIDNCHTAILDREYNDAISLMEGRRYTEAISAFEELDGYKDSANKISDCYTAILEGEYNDAVALADARQYEDAIAAFEALGNYKDSAKKASSVYAQYEIEELKAAIVGDYVFFGAYEQDGNTSNGKEKTEWLVLDKQGDQILVVSRYGLDCKPYEKHYEDVTWETCNIRKWLNEDFLNAAFSAEEQAFIPSTTVLADKNPDWDTNPGNDTQDKIFLLSIPEVGKYFISGDSSACTATNYATKSGVKTDGGFCKWWWLRSPGYDQRHAAFVFEELGARSVGLEVYFDLAAVRPALWINLHEL